MFFSNKVFSFGLLLWSGILSTVESAAVERSLSAEKILQYTPESVVTDHAAVDIDQKVMEEQLALRTDNSFEKARGIYSEGAYSKAYAIVSLKEPIAKDISKDVLVFGYTSANTEMRLTTLEKAAAGDLQLKLRYFTIGMQASYSNCQVGKNPSPNTIGCLNTTGKIAIESLGEYEYSYDPLTANRNARSLEKFSTEAQIKMYQCGPGCPIVEYEKFYSYYGTFDYAHQWVTAAFDKRSTPFTNGNADFARFGYLGREEAIKKGTAYMSVSMNVVRELNHAINACFEDDSRNINAWDEAVAFYVGSVAKRSNGENGYFSYNLAEQQCVDAGTCDGSQNGISHVNRLVYDEFNRGQGLLRARQCEAAKEPANRIIDLMSVPLIQGTLRNAYLIDKRGDVEEDWEAATASFAAAVLPRVHHCSPEDAATIFENTRVGATGRSFDAVKKAFENQYSCMGIKCQDVGGMLDLVNGGYAANAEPCGSSDIKPHMTAMEYHAVNEDSQGLDTGGIVGVVIACVAACFAVNVVLIKFFTPKNQIEFDSSHPPSGGARSVPVDLEPIA